MSRRIAALLIVIAGCALLVAAAGLAFGLPAALTVSGLALLLLGLAGIDVDPRPGR
ncbi:MAG: hypothetical protein AB7G23_20290 [Vicinamibacterales bacterium]